MAVGGDLTTEDGAAAAVDGAVGALGRVDVCVHAAGVWPSEPVPVWELDLARWEATLRADLTAAFLVARAFLRQVAVQGHGNLVLVGSTAALFGEADLRDTPMPAQTSMHGHPCSSGDLRAHLRRRSRPGPRRRAPGG